MLFEILTVFPSEDLFSGKLASRALHSEKQLQNYTNWCEKKPKWTINKIVTAMQKIQEKLRIFKDFHSN